MGREWVAGGSCWEREEEARGVRGARVSSTAFNGARFGHHPHTIQVLLARPGRAPPLCPAA
eukprot:1054491-Rhodomonas_salina.1